MDLLLAGLKQLNVVLATTLVVYAWTILPRRNQRLLFLFMLLAFTISTVLFFPEGEVNEWVKHAPFYIGQVLFFAFVFSLNMSRDDKKLMAKKGKTASTMPALFFAATQGVQTSNTSGTEHILVAPLFLLIGASLIVKLVVTKQRYMRQAILFFLLAGTLLTMIHVTEFYIESKGYIPLLQGEPVEVVELLWFYGACAFFMLGLRKYRHVAIETEAQ